MRLIADAVGGRAVRVAQTLVDHRLQRVPEWEFDVAANVWLRGGEPCPAGTVAMDDLAD